MTTLRTTLLSDGSSDRALLPILTWLLKQHLAGCAIQREWADLRRLPSPRPLRELNERIDLAVELYPCDLLFIHRDAERDPRPLRVTEIEKARQASGHRGLPAICVVPVRMIEAWLLFDEPAIRRASGNPNGQIALDLPSLRDIEGIPDPKDVLHELLRSASELRGRRLKKLNVSQCALRVADHISDFSPLRELSAFGAMEQDLGGLIHELGW